MWHDWQLRVSLNSLCSHSWYGTCSGSSPITLPCASRALVKSVWQVAQSSEDRMCLLSFCWNADDDFMILVWPWSISNGPKT